MAVDRRIGLQAVEQLLKQGKLQAALGELQRVSGDAANDLLTLNRLGDLLARQGRRPEAIEYYRKIAGQFEDGGFVPKAIAIYKKILRLDPRDLHSIIRLGDLYFRENLRGEARNYLLHAANQYLESQEFGKAREIFERLVAVDPQDLRHKLRLAEARAAAGENREAGEELLALSRSLLDADQAPEAEKLYRRAAELLPDSHLPTLGLARCLSRQGRAEEAREVLEGAVTAPSASPAVLGELALFHASAARFDDALELLAKAPPLDVPQSVWRAVLKGMIECGRGEDFWSRLDLTLGAEPADPRVALLLETLAETEKPAHLPALERLRDTWKRRADTEAVARALSALVAAYEARSMAEEANRAREELAGLRPHAQPPPAPAAPRAAGEPRAATCSPQPRPRVAAPPDLAKEVEAPAVPLNRADEEFATGRLTQAEVLEKYGLQPQALEQIEAVTARYPGHVPAQENRVRLLRAAERPAALAEALAQLAVARRAEGDMTGAQEAAMDAAAGELTPASRRLLAEVGLLGPTTPKRQAQVAPEPQAGGGTDLVIDFDDGQALESSDAQPEPDEPLVMPDEDEDLRSIAEALEAELALPDGEPIAREEDAEQAFEEVFSTFQERVAEQVAADDYRTHYDLGIAYKEMGLVDEAIREFEVATGGGELRRDACTMVALCHRDVARPDEAAQWYRQALECVDGETDPPCDLLYELAEALLDSGDTAAALAEFRDLLELDSTFRDVEQRVSELEARLHA